MKRCILVLFFIILVFLLSGCADYEVVLTTFSSSAAETVSDSEIPDPPAMLQLDSEDDYVLLKQASMLSGEELPNFERYEELLWLKTYGALGAFGGGSLKNNIDAVVSIIEKMSPYFPRIDAAQTKYVSLTMYPDEGVIAFMYQLNDGIRYMIGFKPLSQENDVIAGTVSLTPVFHRQKLGSYEFDLYAYNHMGVRDYLIGQYTVGEFRVSITIDAPKEGESLSLDQFYFVDSDAK